MSQEQAQRRQETVGLMVEAGLPTEEREKAGGADTGNQGYIRWSQPLGGVEAAQENRPAYGL